MFLLKQYSCALGKATQGKANVPAFLKMKFWIFGFLDFLTIQLKMYSKPNLKMYSREKKIRKKVKKKKKKKATYQTEENPQFIPLNSRYLYKKITKNPL